MLEMLEEIKSWLWIPKYWIAVYATLLMVSVAVGELYYWSVYLIGIPLTMIPITYRNLVGGGCSIRFQMCALVKGLFAGFVLMILTSAIDIVVWNNLGVNLGWSPLTNMAYVSAVYQIWFLSGAVGGIGARIVEVRGYSSPDDSITIVGFE
ncbi:MAG: hypothetical protein ACXADF_06970 [Candidatus Thorarchaeota archaeon]|jgi:hypothetical protein